MPRCSFFFQAEDGIRDVAVTGVQTCALPILARAETVVDDAAIDAIGDLHGEAGLHLRDVDDRAARSRTQMIEADDLRQIGRASCRERVLSSVVGVSL